MTAYTYGGNAGDGHRPGDAVARPTRSRTGTTNAPAAQTFTQHEGAAVGLPARRHGLLGRQLPDDGQPGRRRSCGRTRATSRRARSQQKVYRIGKDRSNNAVGVFFYCQQHAREWVTQHHVPRDRRAARAQLRDGPDDQGVRRPAQHLHPAVGQPGRRPLRVPRQQRAAQEHEELLPDHHHDSGGIGNRSTWGVDLNRNNTVGTLFDGYAGASTSCTSEIFTGLARGLRGRRSRTSTGSATRSRASSSRTTSTRTAATSCGRRARTSRRAASRCRRRTSASRSTSSRSRTRSCRTSSRHRGTVILPQRTGPIADALYSAAGNSADENWYKRGIIAYSFEAGAQRITVNPTTGAITRQAVGFQPCFGGPGTTAARARRCNPTGNPPVPADRQRGPRLRRWSSPRATSARSRARWST